MTSTNDKASTSQVSVEMCDDQIAQEIDHLKREVKKVELEVNKLKKQAKVQPPQDNHSNVVKKLEKEKTAPKIASPGSRDLTRTCSAPRPDISSLSSLSRFQRPNTNMFSP
jgi:DNA-binding transcriptional regulator GbsR (MarR family)